MNDSATCPTKENTFYLDTVVVPDFECLVSLNLATFMCVFKQKPINKFKTF